jgi:hypothetical protein
MVSQRGNKDLFTDRHLQIKDYSLITGKKFIPKASFGKLDTVSK